MVVIGRGEGSLKLATEIRGRWHSDDHALEGIPRVMDVNHINAFLEATKAIFDTMLKIPITFQRPELNHEPMMHDVSGVIDLSGDVVARSS